MDPRLGRFIAECEVIAHKAVDAGRDPLDVVARVLLLAQSRRVAAAYVEYKAAGHRLAEAMRRAEGRERRAEQGELSPREQLDREVAAAAAVRLKLAAGRRVAFAMADLRIELAQFDWLRHEVGPWLC